MVSPELHDFFLGNVGASAAFIGLLFVALSISPETKLSHPTLVSQRTLASHAYVALINVFFVSAYALIPNRNIGEISVFMGGVALLSNLLTSYQMWRQPGLSSNGTQWLQLLGSSMVYIGELFLGIRLLQDPTQASLVNAVALLLLPIYSLGLGRAWQLLGERSLKKQFGFSDSVPSEAQRKNHKRLIKTTGKKQ